MHGGRSTQVGRIPHLELVEGRDDRCTGNQYIVFAREVLRTVIAQIHSAYIMGLTEGRPTASSRDIIPTSAMIVVSRPETNIAISIARNSC